MFKLLFAALIAGPLLMACNKTEESSDLSYEYTVNGCHTGVVKYSSTEDLCAKLKDDATNKHCASTIRYEQFKKNCPGQSWN